MASRLETLPTEILRLVASNLQAPDLLQLFCTSRRLYGAVPVSALHRSITISSPTCKVLNRLLQRILDIPWLAEATSELEISSSWWVGDTFLMGVLSEPEKFALAGAVESFSGGGRSTTRWLNAIECGDADAMVTLLVMSLPNLEKLTFELPSENVKDAEPKGFFTEITVRCANRVKPFDTSPRLTKLSSVTTSWWDNDSSKGYGAARMHHFLKFPSMRRICAHQMVHRTFPWEWNCKKQSPVTDIEIYNSGFGVNTLVPSCKVLKSFVYQHNHSDPNERIPSVLRDCILSAKDTLETLRLDFESDDEQYGVFGSLSDFVALKHLHIGLAQLVHLDPYFPSALSSQSMITEILPKTLETLYICAVSGQNQYEFLEHLEALTDAASDRFPSLHEILVSNDGYLELSTEETIRSACDEAGIKCTLTFLRGFPYNPSASDRGTSDSG